MITKLRTIIWGLALIWSVASILVISSCSESDDPPKPPEAPKVSYQDSDVAVGTEGKVTAAVQGDPATYEIVGITDQDDAAVNVSFITINGSTGELTIGAESTTGSYKVTVKAKNEGGQDEAVANVTITINNDFNPTGKSYLWKYWMNQSDPWTLSGLDGIPGLAIESVEIPKGWPDGWPTPQPEWTDEYMFPYLALGGVQNLLFQVPGDLACATEGEEGNTLLFKVETDLSLTTLCTVTEPNDGKSVTIGSSSISYANSQFVWTVTLVSQIPVTYIIENPTSETFVDPLDETTPGRQFPAIRGMVESFTTPTNVFDEAGILGSLTQKKVEIILEVLD
ncbi:MAG: immunoglobulin domain-containing protein [Cytophagales bacterium]|nr:immunoglobulin domain-containing protein [Cytophagales bacterium]